MCLNGVVNRARKAETALTGLSVSTVSFAGRFPGLIPRTLNFNIVLYIMA